MKERQTVVSVIHKIDIKEQRTTYTKVDPKSILGVGSVKASQHKKHLMQNKRERVESVNSYKCDKALGKDKRKNARLRAIAKHS